MTGPDDQSEVLAFLRNPATYDGTMPEEVTTHSAIVFLAGDRAFKLKRALRYDYLDFSTPARRRTVLDRELALNKPAAPMIYDRVAAITRQPDGSLAFDGNGPAVDHVLLMNRFPREAELACIAEAGGLDTALAERLGETVAEYHAQAPRHDANGAELIGEIVNELSSAFATMTKTLGQTRVARFDASLRHAYDRLASTLTGRADRVRRCHGDLHLKNVVVLDGQPVLFDALEFDERLGTCDTGYDVAFLIMDMLHRNLHGAANATFNAYLGASGDFGLLRPLPLFLAIRAAIRAMVEVQQMGVEARADLAVDACAYLDEAIAFLDPPAPRVVAVGGVSGTGKTSVARAFAPRLGAAPGAVHLRSDVVRKRILGVAPTHRLGQEGYTEAVTAQVYHRIGALAAEAAAQGQAVILDATFLDASEREAATAAARGVGLPLEGVWLTGDPATLAARIAARRGDASDATVAVMHAQLARAAPPEGWHMVDTGGEFDATTAATQDALQLA